MKTLKEFKIKDIFTIKKVSGKPMKDYEPGTVPYVTGSNNNNGVIGYVAPRPESISEGNCISVDPINGYACYQLKSFVGRGLSGASVNLLYNKNLNEHNALYVCTAIMKIAKPIASYSKLFNSNKLENAKIFLPSVMEYVPDWDLIAYSFGGIDMTAIDTSSWKEFRIGNLFDIRPTIAYKKSNSELFEQCGDIPVLSNSAMNNGIGGYNGLCATEQGNIITFSDTTTGSDTMFYQAKPFIGYSHVQGMYPKNFVLNENIALFLISIMRRTFGSDFDYANKFTRSLVSETKILLPAAESYEPDWGYMEKYIRAVEKLTISDVVKYKESVIAKTKQVVGAADE